MLLTIWLAASYATQLEQGNKTPTASKPSLAAEPQTVSSDAERDAKPMPVARLR